MESFKEVLESVCDTPDDLIIVGDFNIDFMSRTESMPLTSYWILMTAYKMFTAQHDQLKIMQLVRIFVLLEELIGFIYPRFMLSLELVIIVRCPAL